MLPFFRVVVQMRTHNAHLQRFIGLSQVRIAIRQNRPGSARSWLDAYDFLHDVDCLVGLAIDICLIPFPDESLDLLREDWSWSAPFLNMVCIRG